MGDFGLFVNISLFIFLHLLSYGGQYCSINFAFFYIKCILVRITLWKSGEKIENVSDIDQTSLGARLSEG